MREYMNKKVLSTESSCIRKFSEWSKTIDGCIDLTLGEPDFSTPKEIKDAAKDALDCNFTHYPPGMGVESLRSRISQFEFEHNNLEYSKEEIIVTNGATEAVASTLKAILNPGDEVILPTPTFGLYRAVIELYGGKCVVIDTSEEGFQLSEKKLKEAFTSKTKCLILNYPNNPTGAVLDEETGQMLHEFVRSRNLFVLCDEVYDGLTHKEGYFSFAQYEDIREKLIVIKSFSKTYAMTGWRVGYLMADKPIASEIFKVHQYTVSGVSHFSQIACLMALECDVSQMGCSYQERIEYVYRRLKAMGMDVMKPRGTFYIFPSVKRYGLTSTEFCHKLALQEKLVLIPGECFEAEGYVRISCCYGYETLREAMGRLERFIQTAEQL